jgi:hypothetical protein
MTPTQQHKNQLEQSIVFNEACRKSNTLNSEQTIHERIRIIATTWQCCHHCQSQDTAQMDETRLTKQRACALAA